MTLAPLRRRGTERFGTRKKTQLSRSGGHAGSVRPLADGLNHPLFSVKTNHPRDNSFVRKIFIFKKMLEVYEPLWYNKNDLNPTCSGAP